MMMNENIEMDKIIRPTILKAIADKNEEKRRYGRAELEKLIYEYATRYSPEIVETIIANFSTRYLQSTDISKKIVGLEVMQSIISAIHEDDRILYLYEKKIITCILRCLNDSESKIRLNAIKTVFQITKLLGQHSLRLFNLIFQKIIGCVNDVDDTVKDSCLFLSNNSLKDILLSGKYDSSDMNFPEFINILKLKLKTMNLQVRLFLLDWIRDIMDFDLYIYFSDFLEDLLFMIGEKQLQEKVEECLSAFEQDLKQKFHDGTLQKYVPKNYINEIVSTLVKVAKSKSSSLTKYHTLIWFQLIFIFFKEEITQKGMNNNPNKYFKTIIIERFDEILEPILLLISNQEQQVRKESINANDLLMEAMIRMQRQQPVNFVKVIPILKEALTEKKMTNTTEYAINWLKFMLQSFKGKLIPQVQDIVERIMEKIYQSTGKGINDIIESMRIKEQSFNIAIQIMVSFLQQKGNDNEYKVESMIKKFIDGKESINFLKLFCLKLQNFKTKSQFMYSISNSLNSILINEEVMQIARNCLRNRTSKTYKQLFMMLYETFKYNPPAAISLCLLAQQYQLALMIVNTLSGKYEISPKILMDLCKLVNLIEKPAFFFLRMDILSDSNEILLQCLNELLMILPQGKIFNMLKSRLDSRSLCTSSNRNKQISPSPINIFQCFSSYQRIFGIER